MHCCLHTDLLLLFMLPTTVMQRLNLKYYALLDQWPDCLFSLRNDGYITTTAALATTNMYESTQSII